MNQSQNKSIQKKVSKNKYGDFCKLNFKKEPPYFDDDDIEAKLDDLRNFIKKIEEKYYYDVGGEG